MLLTTCVGLHSGKEPFAAAVSVAVKVAVAVAATFAAAATFGAAAEDEVAGLGAGGVLLVFCRGGLVSSLSSSRVDLAISPGSRLRR